MHKQAPPSLASTMSVSSTSTPLSKPRRAAVAKLIEPPITSGEWREDGDSVVVAPVPDDGGDIICLEPDADVSCEHWEKANRRFIAASPRVARAAAKVIEVGDEHYESD